MTDHQPYRSSYRADVAPLHDALNSPSPLGSVLDNIHRRSNSEEYGDGGRPSLSPGSPQGNLLDVTLEYSIFGEGSLATSVANTVVHTIVDGVHHSIAHWKILLFGQIISFFLAVSGAASEELNGSCQISIPLTQTALVGIILMFIGAFRMKGWCAGCCLRRRGTNKISRGDSIEEEKFCAIDHSQDENASMIRNDDNEEGRDDSSFEDDNGWQSDDEHHTTTPIAKPTQPRSFLCGLQTIHAPWWGYFFSAIIAVEARYFIFLSFRYTSLSFIYLVDALAIPSAMAFSKCLLGRKYWITHVLGGLLCITGIIVSTVSDVKGQEVGNIGSRSDVNSIEHLKGDLLAISGAVLLGLDDVLSEMLVKNYGGVDELIFVKWFYGTGIAIIQLVILERDRLAALFANEGGEPCNISTRFLLLGGYVLFQVLDMFSEIKFLSLSESALLNLSLLTSDLWATLFSVFVVGLAPSALYYAAIALIVSGIVLYEAGPSPLCHSTPSDIKITTMHNTDITEHATNVGKDGKEIGDLEMT